MKAYICDQCGTTAEPEKLYELTPVGWYNFTKRIDTGQFTTQHLCGEGCLLRYAGQEQPELPAVEPPAAMPAEMPEAVRSAAHG